MMIEKTQLAEMMEEREKRVLFQQQMQAETCLPLVSLSMNIAGDIKNTPAIEFIFDKGLELFLSAAGKKPEKKMIRRGKCGPHGLFAFDMPADTLKDICVAVEEGKTFPRIGGLGECGRLFDFDVIDPKGVKLSRQTQRRCIVCGGPVSLCARSRAHGLERIKEVTDELIINFMSTIAAKMASDALKDEARLTPKPGLVDSANNGAHKDMDLGMFLDSAEVLSEHFMRFFVIGAHRDDCIDELIAEGIKAEETMFRTTGGVNTHKGAIFNFALVLAAWGGQSMRGGDLGKRIISLAGSKAERGVTGPTHKGGRALEEALKGYPLAFSGAHVLAVSTPYRALCTIMAELTDSNLLYRGGAEALAYVQSESRRILELPDEKLPEALEILDRILSEKNLSPGGGADILGLAMLLQKLKYPQ